MRGPCGVFSSWLQVRYDGNRYAIPFSFRASFCRFDVLLSTCHFFRDETSQHFHKMSTNTVTDVSNFRGVQLNTFLQWPTIRLIGYKSETSAGREAGVILQTAYGAIPRACRVTTDWQKSHVSGQTPSISCYIYESKLLSWTHLRERFIALVHFSKDKACIWMSQVGNSLSRFQFKNSCRKMWFNHAAL